jgi:hypothetical protein
MTLLRRRSSPKEARASWWSEWLGGDSGGSAWALHYTPGTLPDAPEEFRSDRASHCLQPGRRLSADRSPLATNDGDSQIRGAIRLTNGHRSAQVPDDALSGTTTLR